mmetsp:Transcript_22070/g.24664  ORF Transcript_22070/g.24664 Transcript_22070/m.24664 type:complete len:721 (-) Transcript_22070:80-2242(-)
MSSDGVNDEVDNMPALLRREAPYAQLWAYAANPGFLTKKSARDKIKQVESTLLNSKTNKQTLLDRAVSNGNIRLAVDLVNCSKVKMIDGITGNTVLHALAKYKHKRDAAEKLVAAVFKRGVDVDETNRIGNTALHICVFRKNYILIAMLLAMNAGYLLKNDDGISPLHWIILNGDEVAARLICQSQGKNDVPSNVVEFIITKYYKSFSIREKQLLLFGAIDGGFISIFNTWLDKVDINLEYDKARRTPFEHASVLVNLKENKSIITILQAMVDSKKLILSGVGNAPMHLVTWNPSKRNLNIQKMLLRYVFDMGYDCNKRHSKRDDTLLHRAVLKSSVETVKFLIACGTHLNHKNSYGETVFHHAARVHNSRMARCLLSHVRKKKHVERLLGDSGPNGTPYEMAKSYGHHETLSVICEYLGTASAEFDLSPESWLLVFDKLESVDRMAIRWTCRTFHAILRTAPSFYSANVCLGCHTLLPFELDGIKTVTRNYGVDGVLSREGFIYPDGKEPKETIQVNKKRKKKKFLGVKKPSSRRNSLKEKADLCFKLTVFGNSGVGKTSLINKYCDSEWEFGSRSVFEYKDRHCIEYGRRIKLRVHDIWYNESYMRPFYGQSPFRANDIALILYDTTNEQSFENVKDWLEEIARYAPLDCTKVLVGTKVDLVEERKVPWRKVQALCTQEGLNAVETTVKWNINIIEAFRMAIRSHLSQDFGGLNNNIY